MMESPRTLTHDLNLLIQNYGLAMILEAINDLIKMRVSEIEEFTDQFDRQQITALKNATQALTDLSQSSLIEMDVEIALEQLMHASDTTELHEEHLSTGLE